MPTQILGHSPALAAERVDTRAHIEVLEPEHPERRFVAGLCLSSCRRRVKTGPPAPGENWAT
jgi:hypothetical protein